MPECVQPSCDTFNEQDVLLNVACSGVCGHVPPCKCGSTHARTHTHACARARTAAHPPFSRFLTFLEVRVMRMRWMGAAPSSTPTLLASVFVAICAGGQSTAEHYTHTYTHACVLARASASARGSRASCEPARLCFTQDPPLLRVVAPTESAADCSAHWHTELSATLVLIAKGGRACFKAV